MRRWCWLLVVAGCGLNDAYQVDVGDEVGEVAQDTVADDGVDTGDGILPADAEAPDLGVDLLPVDTQDTATGPLAPTYYMVWRAEYALDVDGNAVPYINKATGVPVTVPPLLMVRMFQSPLGSPSLGDPHCDLLYYVDSPGPQTLAFSDWLFANGLLSGLEINPGGYRGEGPVDDKGRPCDVDPNIVSLDPHAHFLKDALGQPGSFYVGFQEATLPRQLQRIQVYQQYTNAPPEDRWLGGMHNTPDRDRAFEMVGLARRMEEGVLTQPATFRKAFTFFTPDATLDGMQLQLSMWMIPVPP